MFEGLVNCLNLKNGARDVFTTVRQPHEFHDV